MKHLLLSLFFLFLPNALFSLSITLSPLNPIDLTEKNPEYTGLPDFSHRLIQAVKVNDLINTLHISSLKDEKPVLSLLDAGTLAAGNSIDYLLYGTIYRENSWLEVRLSLYERETDQIRTVFYGKAEASRHDDLIHELAGKICRYFYLAFQIEPARIQKQRQTFWTNRLKTGYWGVLPYWNSRLTGISTLAYKGSLTPDSPVFYLNDFTLYPGFGLHLGYSLGLNKPEYESFTYHSIQFAFPVDLSLQWRDKHRFTLSVMMGDQIDVINQSRLYGEPYSAFSQAFFINAALIYEFLIPESNWSIGFSQEIEHTLYDPPLMAYKPCLYWGYRFSLKEVNLE